MDTRVKCTLRSPGPSFGSRALPVVRPLRFRVLTLQFPSAVRQAAASLAPWFHGFKTRLFWMHGTARCRRLCDYGDFYAVFKSAVRARY
ncbi:DUF1472 domain-containing protein [Salmonella enterica]|nr:DUF1472 domain-containing protein [Salmonella enterica]EFR3658182.1 DUF1472 domain-containing protein [Salmonella enterica]